MGKPENINEGLKVMAETENAFLLDVRRPDEYEEGHVKGSRNIPLDKLPAAVMNGELSKDKKYFVYCRSGVRSKRACAFLEKSGYDATDIGGILDYTGEQER